ncbi:universal stress protein [Spirosoma sp.]|uniref:universal stress protein n=1 Tax=Spirosoma sp. TaxID=1899569 RepID=UPI00260E72E3|nr:universal stress protein [Spirosoma sp.]MCX6219165.1 universal stress protein [Spirosoma sp.]
MDALSVILVPVNHLSPTLNTLDVAMLLCYQQRTTIHLVCILDPDRMEHSPVYGLDESIGIETEKIQTLATRMAQKYQINCTGSCRMGPTIDELVAAANEISADLVIMDTHIGSDTRAFRLNSDAYNVLKAGPCPVLTVPDQQRWTSFRHILFPVRPVTGALNKYEFARMISVNNDAQLTVLAMAAPDEVISIRELQDELLTLNSKLNQDEVKHTVLFHPTDQIMETVLEKAAELTADLLIITAGLGTTPSNFHIGPFSQQIIHNARVPVLSIRPDIHAEQPKSTPFWKYGLSDPGLTTLGF